MIFDNKFKKELGIQALVVHDAAIESRAQDFIDDLKQDLINDFLNHPVTQDIIAGSKDPTANTDISNSLGGVSNLFAFIGFDRGSDPIQPILEVFDKQFALEKRGAPHIAGGLKYSIKTPTPQEVFDVNVTPMPWNKGRSWAQGIELGISGLNQLIRLHADADVKSKSGGAIQSKRNRVRPGKYQNQKYISFLLNEYKKRARNPSIF